MGRIRINTEENLAEIDILLDEGHSLETIAQIIGVTSQALGKALKRSGYEYYSGFFKPNEKKLTIYRKPSSSRGYHQGKVKS